MTPLDEAWKLPKVKKFKNMNKYSTESVQKEILENGKYDIVNEIPTGNDIKAQQYKYVDDIKLEKEKLHIEIDDENILALLKPYNSDYVKKIVNDGIKKILETPKKTNVESFVGNIKTKPCDDSIIIYILTALFILDITFKF